MKNLKTHHPKALFGISRRAAWFNEPMPLSPSDAEKAQRNKEERTRELGDYYDKNKGGLETKLERFFVGPIKKCLQELRIPLTDGKKWESLLRKGTDECRSESHPREIPKQLPLAAFPNKSSTCLWCYLQALVRYSNELKLNVEIPRIPKFP